MHILYVQTLRKKSSGNNAQPVIIVLSRPLEKSEGRAFCAFLKGLP